MSDEKGYGFKITVIGDGAVGKTSLIKKYTQGSFQNEYIASVSLFVMLLSTATVILLLLKFTTNKFKPSMKMKELRVEDGPKRDIRK